MFWTVCMHHGEKIQGEMQARDCCLKFFISGSCCSFILGKYLCVFPSGIGSAVLKSEQLQSIYNIKDAIRYHQNLALLVSL